MEKSHRYLAETVVSAYKLNKLLELERKMLFFCRCVRTRIHVCLYVKWNQYTTKERVPTIIHPFATRYKKGN